MNFYRYLLLILSLQVFASAAAEQKFAIVSSQGEIVCVSFAEGAPVPGSLLTLVDIDPPQSYFTASLGEKTNQCGSLANAGVSGPYFKLVINDKFGPGFVGVAVYGKHKAVSKNGIVFLNAGWNGDAIYFSSCTSREGLHVFSWLGSSMTEKPLWQGYFYLGYEVEPNCEDWQLPLSESRVPSQVFCKNKACSRLETVEFQGGSYGL